MMPENIPVRFSAAASIDYLDALLHIDKSRYSQDWELEIADPGRLPEFLDVYGNQTRNDDDRFTLMELIISSFDESMVNGVNEEIWDRIQKHLLTEFHLHQYTIMYWCCIGETDPENVFTITPLMRKVWKEFYTETKGVHDGGW